MAPWQRLGAVASAAATAGFLAVVPLDHLAPCCGFRTLWCVTAAIGAPACALGGGWVAGRVERLRGVG